MADVTERRLSSNSALRGVAAAAVLSGLATLLQGCGIIVLSVGPTGSGGISIGGGGYQPQPPVHRFKFDKDELLRAHNKHRCQHGVVPLQWSDAIAARAQGWADQTNGEMVHSSLDYRQSVAGFDYLGENLFKGDVPMTPAVDAWYGEVQYTSNNGRVTTFDPRVGHYTQVVWKETTHVGCGWHDILLVCEYGPAGNVQGQFASQVMPVISGKSCTGYEIARLLQQDNATEDMHQRSFYN